MTNDKKAVMDFFSRYGRSPLPKGDEALKVAYLDAGIIDSLGIITLVSELEAQCNIRFSAEDMQSYEFQTVGGLIKLVERLAASKK